MWHKEVVWAATLCLTEGCLTITLDRGPRIINGLLDVCAFVLHVDTSWSMTTCGKGGKVNEMV